MKVYCVLEPEPYEGDELLAVFSTREKAEAYVLNLPHWIHRSKIVEWTVDECSA